VATRGARAPRSPPCAPPGAPGGRRQAQATLVEQRAELVQRLRLHRVAAGQRVRSYPVAQLVGHRVRTVRGTAQRIDLNRRLVLVSGPDGRRELPFDQVVMALGSTIERHQVPGVAEHARSLADPAAAERLRLELRHLGGGTIVTVCGAGMTGIEAAAEFAAARADLRVRLLAAGHLGAWLSARGRDELGARLTALGVETVEHARVAELQRGRLTLHDGAEMTLDAAVWCAGFVAHQLARDSGPPVDARGCLLVDATLRAIGYPHVLGAGDAAAIPPCPTAAHSG
jgi:NADH:quinone reductase (non-electrogenic)